MFREIKQTSKTKEKGVILLISIILLGILLTMSSALVGYTALQVKGERQTLAQGQALALAEAGIDKAISNINTDPSYNGETGTMLGNGEFSVTVSTIDSSNKQITATGYVPDSTNPVATRIVKVGVDLNTSSVSFNFGVQVGAGGLSMSNNSQVNGNVFSNGNISGTGVVTGSATVAGGTATAADQSWSTQNGDSLLGNSSARSDMAQSFVPSTSNVLNKVSLYIKKVGSPTNITVRILSNSGSSPTKTTLATGTMSSSNVTGTYGFIDASFASAPTLVAGTTYWILLDASVNASNYFVWGYDTAGGYTSGNGKYSANWNANTPVWNDVGGDLNFQAWMGGVVTSLSGVTVNGTARANTMTGCTVLGDAHYATTNTCAVGGATYSGQPDSAPQAMPISSAQISNWKQTAEAGGVITGNYTISTGTTTLGPIKIVGNLTVNSTLNLTGPVWVEGDITFDNSAILTIDPSLGGTGTVLLADNPANMTGSGYINLLNNVTLSGNGNAGSFPLVISTKSSGTAINLSNNVSGGIFYSANGVIDVSNNVTAQQLTGYSISLSNNAIINYTSGLASAGFSNGPGGSWQFTPGTYFISK